VVAFVLSSSPVQRALDEGYVLEERIIIYELGKLFVKMQDRRLAQFTMPLQNTLMVKWVSEDWFPHFQDTSAAFHPMFAEMAIEAEGGRVIARLFEFHISQIPRHHCGFQKSIRLPK
jgi:hypothetical protein